MTEGPARQQEELAGDLRDELLRDVVLVQADSVDGSHRLHNPGSCSIQGHRSHAHVLLGGEHAAEMSR